MNEINKIRSRLHRLDSKKDRGSSVPPDVSAYRLRFNRDAGEEWSFHDNRVYLNGDDIEDLLDEAREDVKFLSAVSDAVSEYKDFVWKNGNGAFAKFSICADRIQTKILDSMKRIYDERTGGVRLTWGDGAYLLNNVNIRAIIALYHIRPTEKARKFLDGLKSKLALILVNKSGSTVAKLLYDEVLDALGQAPIDGRYLPVDSGRDRG